MTRRFLLLLERFGKPVVVSGLAALVVIFSMSVSIADSLLFDHAFLPSLYLSTLIPLLTAPPIIFFFINNTMKMDRTEKTVKSIIENAGDAFFIHDQTGNIIEVNDAACGSLGYSRDELLGMSVTDIEVGHNPELLYKHWNDLIQGTALTLQGQHRRKDGTMFPIEARVSIFSHGNEFNIIALARDVTDRKEYEEMLTRAQEGLELRVEERTRELVKSMEEAVIANQAKTEFLSSMSHELRTPMNAILGFGQLLEHNPKEPLSAKQREHTQHILKGGRHLLDLIDQVLELSTIEAGKVSLSVEKVRPKDVIKECLMMVTERVHENEVNLEDHSNETVLPLLWTDKNRFRQALLNLLIK